MKTTIRIGTHVGKQGGLRAGFASMLLLACLTAGLVNGGPLVTQDLASGLTATDLVNTLVGGGVVVSNVSYTGANVAAGRFTGGTGIIGFESGIILSAGDIANVIGPNEETGINSENGTAGDPDLEAIIDDDTNDAAVLEFDFVPTTSVLRFSYVFASDEYNEFVGEYNDAFAFFVNGVNQALVPGTSIEVSINTVNNDENSAYYIDNDDQDGFAPLDTEMDGVTTVLTVTATVNPGVVNHLKLAIADALDEELDSVVFIAGGSITSSDVALSPASAAKAVGTQHTVTATVRVDSSPVPGVTVAFSVVAGPHAGASGSAVTVTDGTATWSYMGTLAGTDTIQASAAIGESRQTSNNAYATWTGTSVPVAVNDAYTTPEDTTLNVSAPGVLGNDTAGGVQEVKGTVLTAVKVTNPAHGTVTLSASGSFSYVPVANYNGPDSFTYKANNGTTDTNVATVAITVTAVNDAPVAVADAYSTPANITLNRTAPGLLANDSDVEGGTLTVVRVTSPTHGTLTLNANGSFTYVPTADYSGSDSFSYKTYDGAADSNTVTVSLTVTPVASGSSWLVYDYKANLKRLDTYLDKVKYSANAYDQKANTEAYLDTATATADSLKGYLMVPICVGCNENGTGSSLDMGSLLYVTRKDDKTRAVWKFGTAVSAGIFAKNVAGRFNENVEDDLQEGPTSLKGLNEAWMSFSFDFLAPDGLTISGPFGVDYLYGFLGIGSLDGSVAQAGFGKVKIDRQSSVGVCGGSTTNACFMISTISGCLTGTSTWTYVCGPAIWDLCSINGENLVGTLLDPSAATVDGTWSIKLNSKVSAQVNGASSDAAKQAIIVDKLGGGELIGDDVTK